MTRDQALQAVASVPGINPTRLAVVLALLRHSAEAPEGLQVAAAQAQVAADACVTDRSVRAVLADLVGLGLVSERGRRITFGHDFDPEALTLKAEARSGSRNDVPESGSTFRKHVPEVGSTFRKSEARSGGTAPATCAPSSLSEQISLERELAVPRAPAHEPTHAHEAPDWSEAFTGSGATAGTAGDPPPVVVAQQAWSEAFGVSQLPRRIDDAVAEALGTYPLEVVCQAADDLGAYLADHPAARPNLLRTPRCVADRCAKAAERSEGASARGRRGGFSANTQPDRDSWGRLPEASPFRLWNPGSGTPAAPAPAAQPTSPQALGGWGSPPRKDSP